MTIQISPRNPLSQAIRGALLGLSLVGTTLPFLAQAAESAALQQAVSWDIPAGALQPALDSFARQAGISLSYDAATLAGKTTTGVSGTLDSWQALNTLLQESGLQAVQQGEKSVLLVPRSESTAGALELGATSVTGEGLGGVTEGTGSYTTGAVSIGKTAQSLRRTPQSVSVLTEQRLKDQNLTNLTQILEQTPGVIVEYFDSERVQYYSRGFQIDAIQFDGATVVQGSGGGAYIQSDAAMVDHIEMLRGASGMLRGSGNPSGTANIVRKRPTRDFQASASVTAGSWDSQRYVADLSGPLVADGTIRGRLIAVHDDKDFFQKSRMERKNALYGVLSADLSDSTTLTGGLEYTDLDASGSWGGLPADFNGKPLDLDRDTYLGATWNRWDRSNLQTFTELEHLFNNDWKLKLAATPHAFRAGRQRLQADLHFPHTRCDQPVPDERAGHRGRWRRKQADQPQRLGQWPVLAVRPRARNDHGGRAHPQRLLRLGDCWTYQPADQFRCALLGPAQAAG